MIDYLSPSSYKDWKHCGWRFKLIRIDGIKKQEIKTINLDVGTVFDAHVKRMLNRRLLLSVLLKDVPEDIPAMHVGRNLAAIYQKSGALKHLVDEGVGHVEIDKEFLVNGIPVYGKPDFVMHDGTIGDWKTSLSGSPRPGYYRRIEYQTDTELTIDKEPHEKNGINLEQVDQDWAIQVTIYAFLMGKRPTKGLKARIEHIVTQVNKVVICSYNTEIGFEFQNLIYEDLRTTWNDIMAGRFPAPTFDKYKCFKWGRTCEVADYCTAFQKHLKDEANPQDIMKQMLGGL